MKDLGRHASLSGLVFAVLFGVGSGLWVFHQPRRSAGTAEILEFFESASVEILIGGTISIVSYVFLVWFGAVLHNRLAAADTSGESGLALVAFGGTVLFAAVGLAAETINMAGAMSAEDGQLSGDAAQTYFDLTYAFGAHAAGIAFAIVALPIGVTALRTKRLTPGWGGWVALVLGLALLTPAMLNRAAFLILYSATVVLIGALSLHLHRTSSALADSGG